VGEDKKEREEGLEEGLEEEEEEDAGIRGERKHSRVSQTSSLSTKDDVHGVR
jgi:hypothetical protein